MTSPPDVQNVPDVWALLQRARDFIVADWAADHDVALPSGHIVEILDYALAQRDRFVLVPREATQEMRRAGVGQWMHGEAEAESRARYIAMLAAAPKPIQGSIEWVETHGPYKATFVEPTEPFNAPKSEGKHE